MCLEISFRVIGLEHTCTRMYIVHTLHTSIQAYIKPVKRKDATHGYIGIYPLKSFEAAKEAVIDKSKY